MATRQKTIEFATTVDTATLAGGSNRDKSIALYIPETVVAFRSVTLLCYLRGDNTAAANLGTVNLSIATNSGFTGLTTVNLGAPVANSGDHETWWYAADVTSFFTTNWSGTSNTWWVRYNGATLATANHSFKLVITYDYDDTASTHIKTVRIPIESTRSILTAAMQTIGGATAIPAITGGYLPESSVVVRQAFLELAGNDAGNATTDFTLQMRVNGGTTRDVWRAEQQLNSAGWAYFTYDITSETTYGSARSLEMQSTLTGRGDWMGGWLTVTYEFDPAASTTIFNSLVLGAIDTTGWMGGTTSANADAWGRNILIDEPGTITLKESAVQILCNIAATTNANVSVGSQGYTTYQLTAGSAQTGQNGFTHRIDAGGQAGSAGITLAHGLNAYLCKVYSATADDGWGVNGILILNYTSGKSTTGVGAHSQSRFHLLSQCTNDNYRDQVDSKSVPIPESQYWLNGVCTEGGITTDNSTNSSACVQAERQAGEGEGLGWETIGVTQYRSDNENMFLNCRYASRKSWKRWVGDPDPDRMDLEVVRSFRLDTPLLSTSWFGLWVTYNSDNTSSTITVAGSNGGTVTVDIHRVDTNEKILAGSRTGNGDIVFTWGTSAIPVYAVAYEDSTHLGRSANFNFGD